MQCTDSAARRARAATIRVPLVTYRYGRVFVQR